MATEPNDTAAEEQSTNTSIPAITRRQILRGTAAAGALGMLSGVGSAQETSGRHIVGLEAGTSYRVATARATSVYRRLDFGSIGKMVAGQFSKRALAALEKRGDVRYVEPDRKRHLIAETLPWGIDRVDAEKVHANGKTGEGADITIIDTGIDLQHPDLKTNIGQSKSFVGYTDSPDDDAGHGTFCAGIADATDNTKGVIGVSTQATLHAAKGLGADGFGYVSDLNAAIKWTADNGYDVANQSYGGAFAQSEADACEYAYGKGVLLVAAAGNDSGPVGYPAALPTVIAVSATDQNDDLANFSNRGPEIELAAPGVAIYSTLPIDLDNDGYGYGDGTSFSCPHVAGAGGLLMANGFSNTEARDRLNATAENIGLPPKKQGNGLLDVAAAVSDPAEPPSQIAEFGTVTGDHRWQTVALDGSYEHPTVVMGPLSHDGPHPCHVRLRNVGSDSFEWRVEEWDYLDGNHPNEEAVHYVVMERGLHTLADGTKIGAGYGEADETFRKADYGHIFDKRPISVVTPQTHIGHQSIVPRQRNVGKKSLEWRVDEQETKKNESHRFERVGALLMEPGASEVGDTAFEARRMPDTVTDEWFEINWGQHYDDPVFVAAIETFDGWQPCELRYRNLTETGVEVFIEEEQSKDKETNHTSERVDVMVFEGGDNASSEYRALESSSGMLYGTTESGSPGSLTDTDGS